MILKKKGRKRRSIVNSMPVMIDILNILDMFTI